MLFILWILTGFSSASAGFDQSQVNFGGGMVNAGFTETPSGLQSTSSTATPETAASGSVATMSAFVDWEKFLSAETSVLSRAIVPLLPGAAGSYIGFGAGLNRYFKSLSSVGSFVTKDAKLTIVPKWRFYYGGMVTGAYLIYNTETAKKSDTQVELGGQAGAIYNKDQRWGYKSEFGFARAVGFNTTAMTMKIFFGAVYNLR